MRFWVDSRFWGDTEAIEEEQGPAQTSFNPLAYNIVWKTYVDRVKSK